MNIFELNREVRRKGKYDTWKRRVMKTSSSCMACGSSRDLVAHHKTSVIKIIVEMGLKNSGDLDGCEELWDVRNGVVICRRCHIYGHRMELEMIYRYCFSRETTISVPRMCEVEPWVSEARKAERESREAVVEPPKGRPDYFG